AGRWGSLAYHAPIDLSALDPGQYRLVVTAGRQTARAPLRIGDGAMAALIPDLLAFLRHQRCGYNPFLDAVCHPFDGRTAYGPRPPGTYVDARGGWHDA